MKSFSDVDIDILQYLASTPEKRREMCSDLLAVRGLVYAIVFVVIAVFLTYCYYKGIL